MSMATGQSTKRAYIYSEYPSLVCFLSSYSLHVGQPSHGCRQIFVNGLDISHKVVRKTTLIV